MAIFDPTAVDRQITQLLTTIPPGKQAALIGHYDHKTRSFSLAVATKVGGALTVYAKLSKPLGKDLEAEAGAKLVFFLTQQDLAFSKWEVFKLLRPRLGILGAAKAAFGKSFEVPLVA